MRKVDEMDKNEILERLSLMKGLIVKEPISFLRDYIINTTYLYKSGDLNCKSDKYYKIGIRGSLPNQILQISFDEFPQHGIFYLKTSELSKDNSYEILEIITEEEYRAERL